eukprot:2236705-Lingulodinium_polyedra.AAC.1
MGDKGGTVRGVGFVPPRGCGVLAGHAGQRRHRGGHGRRSDVRGLVRHWRRACDVPQHAEGHR